MKEIKPSKKEVFAELRNGDGCCWLGGSGCHCHSRDLARCYAETEKRLTKHEYTEEEITEKQKQNIKAMFEIDKILGELFG